MIRIGKRLRATLIGNKVIPVVINPVRRTIELLDVFPIMEDYLLFEDKSVISFNNGELIIL